MINKKRIIITLLIALTTAVAFNYFYNKLVTPKTTKNIVKKLNISWFIFMDVNRNGIYDIEDKPYSGLPIKLLKPNGKSIIMKSNLNGFTNFIMGNNPNHAMITEEGEYIFEAFPHENLLITTKNKITKANFQKLSNSPAGIILLNPLKALGVAPKLKINGIIEKSDNITAISPSMDKFEITPNSKGFFSFTATSGTWKLINRQKHTFKTQIINVKSYPIILSKYFFDSPNNYPEKKIVTVSFDDIINVNSVAELPNNYNGLLWNNWVVTHKLTYEGDGYINGTISKEYLIYNSSGHPASISKSTPFCFIGAYIGVAWPQANNGYVNIIGYRNKKIIYHDKIKLNSHLPNYFYANYKNITKIEIYSDIYWQVIIDDIQFRLQ